MSRMSELHAVADQIARLTEGPEVETYVDDDGWEWDFDPESGGLIELRPLTDIEHQAEAGERDAL